MAWYECPICHFAASTYEVLTVHVKRRHYKDAKKILKKGVKLTGRYDHWL